MGTNWKKYLIKFKAAFELFAPTKRRVQILWVQPTISGTLRCCIIILNSPQHVEYLKAFHPHYYFKEISSLAKQ
jgi:hypothetical protein